jgi:hypothetical protein
MQAYIMNFGDNTRVVNDSSNTAFSIGIGELKECDIHDVHYHMIRRGIATETLLVVPKEIRKTERLEAIMALLKGIAEDPYEEVLQRYNEIVETPENVTLRPTRDHMRLTLRGVARTEVAKALQMQSKVVIHEQGDAVTRQEIPKQPPPEKIESPDRKDKAPREPAKKAKSAKPSKKPVAKRAPSTRKRERL